MARLGKIQSRLDAVQSIRTVTAMMEKVAAARFWRSRQRAEAASDFADRIAALVGDLIRRSRGRVRHPLFRAAPGRPLVLLVLTSDRGLCGSFNSVVVEQVMERMGELVRGGRQVSLRVAGRRGTRYFRHGGLMPDRVYDSVPTPRAGHVIEFEHVAELADELIDEFLREMISGVEISYVQFVSSARQRAALAKVLPLTGFDAPPEAASLAEPVEYALLPAPEDVLEEVLLRAVRMRVYQCFVESAISEQAMRMAAVRAATENADKMIRDLTRSYNRMRQAQITTELAEIVAGFRGRGARREVVSQLREEINAGQGRREVTVVSAVELTPAQRRAVADALGETFHTKTLLRTRVDPALIGGLVVQVGDDVYDVSVASHLERMHGRLVGEDGREAEN